jgi:hypothetical protein
MVMCVPDKPSLHGPIIIKNRPYRTARGGRIPHLLVYRRANGCAEKARHELSLQDPSRTGSTAPLETAQRPLESSPMANTPAIWATNE